MKFVDTSLLRIGYQEWNPQAARSVVLLPGVGHFPQREVPMQVAAALLAFLGDVWAQ